MDKIELHTIKNLKKATTNLASVLDEYIDVEDRLEISVRDLQCALLAITNPI